MTTLSNDDFKDCYGEWALVAGAAEGIGEAFSKALAGRGMNLVMADIHSSVLHDLSEEIKMTFGTATRKIIIDLSEKNAWTQCMNSITDLDCRLLVYVPAYIRIKRFTGNSGDELDRYIDLNARTPLHLVHSFLHFLGEQKKGGILLMSSLAGLIGPPFLAPYASTKAFNILLAESLHSEYRRKNIRISACCAGQTSTPAYWSSNPASGRQWPRVMDPVRVAEYALNNLGKKALLIPGWQNRISYFILSRIFSRIFAARILDRELRKMYTRI